jgi:hypothetical protein
MCLELSGIIVYTPILLPASVRVYGNIYTVTPITLNVRFQAPC